MEVKKLVMIDYPSSIGKIDKDVSSLKRHLDHLVYTSFSYGGNACIVLLHCHLNPTKVTYHLLLCAGPSLNAKPAGRNFEFSDGNCKGMGHVREKIGGSM